MQLVSGSLITHRCLQGAFCLVLVYQGIALAQTPSSVSISASPNPATYGQPVTLTATLTAGAKGKVTFYDGVTVLGEVPVSDAKAALNTITLPSGNRSVKAYYSGDTNYAPSTSASLPLSVHAGPSFGLFPAITSQRSTYTVAMAKGDFNGDNKLDLAMVNGAGNTVTVYLGNGDLTFQPGVDYPAGTSPQSIVVADFNGDGKWDLAISSSSAGTVSMLFGNGDGTFQAPVNITLPHVATWMAAADFDGDGNIDLALTQPAASEIAILGGKGDGTFKNPVLVSYTEQPRGLTVTDLNGDGLADLLIWDVLDVSVLLGNGDLTFQPQITAVNEFFVNMATTGDMNQDGKLDVIVANSLGFDVYSGNGDGTFPAFNFYYTDRSGAVVVEDFNGDGLLDVFTTSYISAINPFLAALFLGPANGRLGAAFLSVLNSPMNLAMAGDFNGDGKVDVIVASNSIGYGVFAILPGGLLPDLTLSVTDGGAPTQGQTGTYTVIVENVGTYSSSGTVTLSVTLPTGLTIKSLTGDGWTCNAAALMCNRADALSNGTTYPSVIVEVNASAGINGTATSTFTVSGGGEEDIANDSVSDTANIRNATTTALVASPSPASLGQPVTLTATPSAGATGMVQFYDGPARLGTATIAAGKATFVTTMLASGLRSLRAYYLGDTSHGGSTSAIVPLTISVLAVNGSQLIATYNVGSAAFGLKAGDFTHDGIADLITVTENDSDINTVCVFPGNGDGSFRAPIYTPIGSNYSGQFLTGDFNNDGQLDVVLLTPTAITFIPGNGDGTFSAPVQVNVGGFYALSNLITADWNGDGNQDLIAMSNRTILLWLGNGDGTFQHVVQIGSGGNQLLAADMNADGKPDLVSLDPEYTNSPVSIFLGNGDGTFQPPITTAVNANYANTMVAGDFNGDGKPDIAVDYWTGVTVLLGNGDGTLKAGIATTLPQLPSNSAVAGDFDGDGKLDFAYVDFSNYAVHLMFGNGDGTFRTGPTLALNSTYGVIVLGDFNGDGRPDFAVGDETALSTVSVFLGGQVAGLNVVSSHTGNFTMGHPGTYRIVVGNPAFVTTSGLITVTDTLPGGLIPAAISGSGWTCTLSSLTCTRSDALAYSATFPAITISVNVDANLSPSVVTNRVAVTYNSVVTSSSDSTATVLPAGISLTATPNPSILGQPVALTATVGADLGGTVLFLDGGTAIGTGTLSGGRALINTSLLPSGVRSLLAIYSGDTAHAAAVSPIQHQNVISAAANTFAPGLTVATGAGPVAIAEGDFDRDGKIDLVTANATANTVSVLLGSGNGMFGNHADIGVGASPSGVVVADFNNDGKPDIAVSNRYSDNVSILLGNGDGSFQPPITVPVLGPPTAMLASDLNTDGNVDLVVASTDAITILLGTGTGNFVAGSPVQNYASLLASADFNQDGKIDILRYDGGLALSLGNGDGTFQPPVSLNVSAPDGLALGDLNGDGIPDILTGNSSNVEALIGKGDGTFQPLVQSALGFGPTGILTMLTADVNGDGSLDVVVLSGGSPGLMVGNGDGTLQPPTVFAAGSAPKAGLAGDFNGDGQTDLAIANSGSNNVTILLGRIAPALTISSAHTGSFALGQTGAIYTLTVTNTGPVPTSGTVTVTDTLPLHMVATSIAGNGWNCTLPTLTCTNVGPVAPGASYSISITVNVTLSGIGLFVNQASVSGGGSNPANASDQTQVIGPVITILTIPAGLQFSWDGLPAQTAPESLNLAPGQQHTLSVVTTQAGPAGTQYVFTGWSDGGAASHAITIGTTPATYTASFKTQYQLTTSPLPASGGSVSPSSAFYDSGAGVSLTASPNAPFVFTSWNGAATGVTNPITVTMDAAKSVTANFNVPGFTCDLNGTGAVNVSDVQLIINQALGLAQPANDLTEDGVVNVSDVQVEINAALGLGCAAR